MQRRVLSGLVMVGLLSYAPAAGADLDTPIAASPGSPHQVSLIEDRCPAFIWAQVAGAQAYELAVYRVGAEGRSPEPVLRRTFPGSVHAWTPALDRCLEPGARYAWTIRAVGAEGPSEWSPPALLRVAGGPAKPGRPPGAEPPPPVLSSLAEFIVDSGGNVQAASYSGSGAGLSDLTGPICDLHARTDLPFPTGLACDCRQLQEKCVLDEHCCSPYDCVGEECCTPVGTSCSLPSDCCGSLLCESGECCVGVGDPCSVPADCCIPLTCFGGSCCKPPGYACTQNSECCNNQCQGGFCALS